MSAVVSKINFIIEQLPEKKQVVLLELVKQMIDPDDFLSEEDIKDIREARAEFARGEFVRHDEIDW